jgi:hypothetical protein
MGSMSTTWLRASELHGTVEIAPQLSFDRTVARIAVALNLTFSKDQSGRYEEYPAYVAKGGGLEFALLGPPLPEHDIRDVKSSEFQLLISSNLIDGPWQGHAVEVSAIYAHFIQEKTGLLCRGLELPATT